MKRTPPTIYISPDDLPVSCPPPAQAKWNLHPRVFLPLSESKPEVSCPYCGARYILKTAASNGKATSLEESE